MAAPARQTRSTSLLDVVSWFGGLEVPDPITFVVGPEWCNRPNLYPRQGTLLKIIFLRDDLFTAYDYDVIEQWTRGFSQTGYNGIQPDILERITMLKAEGRKWFREVLLVMGRRAGKGHLSGLAMSYVLWNYMAKGDPQNFYGVDRSKRLVALIFAGKREQAKANLWKDLVNVITEAPCYAPYISKFQAESLTIFAPQDFVKMRKMAERGVDSVMDPATFEILPKESTLMAGRGPASFLQGYDEMAHVIASGANRSAEEVYAAATPSLDQFGKDGFIVEPSSPWQMMGQFYENYTQSLAHDEETGKPLYPEKLMVQLASWDIYEDWERAHLIPLFNGTDECFQELRGAIQTYDDQMVRLKMSNPETFAVERESKFATAIDAYLTVEKVEAMFREWNGKTLVMEERGILINTYKAHGDPSKTNANFGFAIAHEEYDEEGTVHCVFDLIHHFDPADYPDHTLDYDQIEDWLWDRIITKFFPDEMTFDQFNSGPTIGRLQKKVRAAGLPKRVNVFEITATRAHNWKRAETFKTALNMGWVHAPYYELAELELKFLQEKNGAVEKPTMGPVQTKDVADCMMECVYTIVGKQVSNFIAGDLSRMQPSGLVQGGMDPFPGMRGSTDPRDALSGFSRGGGRPRTNDQFGQGPAGHRMRGFRGRG